MTVCIAKVIQIVGKVIRKLSRKNIANGTLQL